MDFPAFSSICSSNKAECGVNAGWMWGEFCVNSVWMSVVFLLLLSVRMGNPVSLRRRRVKETNSQIVKESNSQRVKESKRQRDKETKSQRDEGTKRGRDKGTRRRKPRHLLFVSYSLPLHRPIRSILFNLCPKIFARFVFKTVLHNRTPLCESSVKVDVGGKLWE